MERKGHKLTSKEKEKLGLDGKVQIFWNEASKGFKAKGRAVDVVPLGMPILARMSYDLSVTNKGYCPYLGEDSYTTARGELWARLEADTSLLEKARYFCMGESYSHEQVHGLGRHDTPQETIVVPVALYVGKK
ncbi:MAG: hypothetical protein V1734_03895 [Nanoarchaeota archaeon]